MAIDDNTIYGLYGSQIKDLPDKINAVKGKAKVLTSADYDWPTNNPDGVAIWKLDTGIYTHAEGVKVYYTSSTNYSQSCLFAVHNNGYQTSCLRVRGADSSMQYFDVNNANGGVREHFYISQPVDNLTSSSEYDSLSANQGKVLKGLIDSIAIRGAGAPTTATVGTVGKLYEDTTNGKLYICTDATNPYVWEEVGGSAGPTVVQTTGTSTTDVMSQNAATSMVFAKPHSARDIRIGSTGQLGDDSILIGASSTLAGSPSRSIGIGYNVTVSNQNDPAPSGRLPNAVIAIGSESAANGAWSIAVGNRAFAYYTGSVALGAGSKPTHEGEVNIGSQYSSYGYNSSNYRLLTGLYDPQNAHDAATKGYVDNSLLGKQDALTAGSGISIADESGSLVISATATEPDTFTTNEWNALWA